MKTCDICKRTNGDGDSLEEGIISTVLIGTSIRVATVGESYEPPAEFELCTKCIPKVNDAIAGHLQSVFGLRFRT